MYNVTQTYLPNKRSSLLLLHSRIPLIECASEYSESLYSRIHIHIRHPVFAIRIVFVTWCIRSSPNHYCHCILALTTHTRCLQCDFNFNGHLCLGSDKLLRLTPSPNNRYLCYYRDTHLCAIPCGICKAHSDWLKTHHLELPYST